MHKQNTYYTYIITNKTQGTLYIGVTSNILKRIYEHKNGTHTQSFSSKYKLKKLVWYGEFVDIYEAISYEKKLKNWHRAWKINLIEKDNPSWDDLSKDWYENP